MTSEHSHRMPNDYETLVAISDRASERAKSYHPKNDDDSTAKELADLHISLAAMARAYHSLLVGQPDFANFRSAAKEDAVYQRGEYFDCERL